MKIMLITPTLNLGGAEIMVENLANALIKLEHEVVVVSLYNFKSPITDRLESNKVDVRYLSKKSGLDISMIWKLKKLFKEEKPDVVHSHNNAMQYAIPAACLAGVKKRCHTVHSVAQKELGGLAKKAAKIFYKRFGVIPVALSDAIADTITQEYKIRKDKIPVIFNGINLEKCKPKFEYKAHIPFNILHLGRFAKEKNHTMLIRAFKQFHSIHPDTVLTLVGDGNERQTIEQTIAECGICDNVRLMGKQADVYGFLGEADVFVLPSLYEGIPLSLIEAMGTGLPIVASKVGGIPDMVVDNESAVLIDVDENALVNALVNLYEDEGLRERLGQNSLNRSNDFSSSVMAERYIDIYKL